MSKVTPLASGQINGADSISVELVEPVGMPAIVRITWPPQPTAIKSERFPDVAAAIAQLFARAHIVLAAIRAERRL